MIEALFFLAGTVFGVALTVMLALVATGADRSEADELRERAEHCERAARLAYVKDNSRSARLYEEEARRARETVLVLTTERSA